VGEGGNLRILILSLVFAPDGVSTAQLMTELATDLRRAGSEVFVITTRPHYNRDLVAEQAQPLVNVWPGLLWRSEIGGVRVYHTRVSAKAGGIFRRAPGWLVFHLLAFLAALMFVRRADVIFVPSPLLTLGVLGRFLRRPLRGKLVYNVQELYPDLAVELGMMRNPLLIRTLRRLERYVYRHSTVVTAITDGIRDAVVRKGVDAWRVVTIPNFVDVGELQPGCKRNAFSEMHGWTGRFVVLYAGNIGYAQGLDALLAAARALESDPAILFAFVGEGAAKAELEERARVMGLANTAFISHQPYSLVPSIYAASDLCVVSLVGEILVGALPSKVFRIMACQRPILAICDPRSDLGAVVREVGTGAVCAPDDTAAIVHAIKEIRAHPDLALQMGERGRRYTVERLSRDVVTARYADLFAEISAASGEDWNAAASTGAVPRV
jgi:colanic acid biosynthesis glycosyl transferase WcaI